MWWAINHSVRSRDQTFKSAQTRLDVKPSGPDLADVVQQGARRNSSS